MSHLRRNSSWEGLGNFFSGSRSVTFCFWVSIQHASQVFSEPSGNSGPLIDASGILIQSSLQGDRNGASVTRWCPWQLFGFISGGEWGEVQPSMWYVNQGSGKKQRAPSLPFSQKINYTFPFQDVHIFLGPFFSTSKAKMFQPLVPAMFSLWIPNRSMDSMDPTAEQLSRFGYQWLCRFHAADHSPTVPAAISVENSGKFIVVERNYPG